MWFCSHSIHSTVAPRLVPALMPSSSIIKTGLHFISKIGPTKKELAIECDSLQNSFSFQEVSKYETQCD